MRYSVRTPLRVSLFGGGTDYPDYFRRAPGAVVGFAIDKYIYISALKLGAYVDYRYRLSYSIVEQVDDIAAIQHPVVRSVLAHYGWDEPTDFSIQADLPASSGLGSSSAFTVGFVNILSQMQGQRRTRMEIAREAIHVEQVLLKENVGVQDQLHATFGGINRFDFHGEKYRITPVNITGAALSMLTNSMLLVFTGIKRSATQVLMQQVRNIAANKVDAELGHFVCLVDEAQRILEDASGIDAIPGRIANLLYESWQIKKRLAPGISLSEIDELYDYCLSQGALGGKLCGAGGGGFLLMVVPLERQKDFCTAIGERRCVKFQVDMTGTQALSFV